MIVTKPGNPRVKLQDEDLILFKDLMIRLMLVRNLDLYNGYFFRILPEADHYFVFNRNWGVLNILMILFEHHLEHLPFD